jgi:iron complex transport system ATP-binding protein
LITLKNIEIGYESTLLSANLSIEQGKLYALVGKNGSGKTTLLQTIIGELPLIKGEILVAEQEINSLTILEKAKRIAFVETRFSGISYLSGLEYVSIGRNPYTNALGRLSEQDKTHIQNAFEALEIKHLSTKFTNHMSDGERQLLQVARALAQETPIILLDEPTAFLDYSNKRILIEKLKKIAQDQNKCILLSCHDLDICLEYELPFLTVSTKNKRIELLLKARKEDVIERAFG